MQTVTAVQSVKEKAKSPAPASDAINLKPLRDALSELDIAAQRVADYSGAYRDLLHTLAEKTGLSAAVIRSFMAARLAESDKTKQRKVERAQQLALVFDEIAP